MARRSKAEKAAEALVEAAFQRHGSNVQFNIMDLRKIMNAGHAAIAEGRDLDAAMIAAVEQYRQN